MKFYPVVVMILVFLTGCVKSVKGVLEAIKGVKSVDVDLASGKTIIEYDAPINISAFEKAIDEAGFEVEQ